MLTPCLVFLCSCSFFLLYFIACSSARSSTSIPRGVHPLDGKYFDSEVIKCKDGSNSFTRDRLNDDFCDCFDGTDEPGTSACPSGKFYCRNLGSTPRLLFSSHVNDHICDCCDGSDEYHSSIYCPNTCIMGGSIEYKTEYRHTTSSNAIQAKENPINGKSDDLFQSFKDVKVLVVLQLVAILYVLAFWLCYRRVKSMKRRYH